MMRIITGKAKGIHLKTLPGDATRPTAERVKEAFFSMLQYELESREVLDLFAGSGQLGLEAVSRGASHACLIDRSADAVNIIRENASKTRLAESCTILRADGLDFIRRSGSLRFDLVFLDPPYASGLYVPVLKALHDAGCLKESSVVVCESDRENVLAGEEALAGHFPVLRRSRYGKTFITLYGYAGEETK